MLMHNGAHGGMLGGAKKKKEEKMATGEREGEKNAYFDSAL